MAGRDRRVAGRQHRRRRRARNAAARPRHDVAGAHLLERLPGHREPAGPLGARSEARGPMARASSNTLPTPCRSPPTQVTCHRPILACTALPSSRCHPCHPADRTRTRTRAARKRAAYRRVHPDDEPQQASLGGPAPYSAGPSCVQSAPATQRPTRIRRGGRGVAFPRDRRLSWPCLRRLRTPPGVVRLETVASPGPVGPGSVVAGRSPTGRPGARQDAVHNDREAPVTRDGHQGPMVLVESLTREGWQ